jgi:hypothetical protein
MTMSICFLIPVKLDTAEQSKYVVRCIESIRRIYPTETIVIAMAKDSRPLPSTVDPTVRVVTNPHFSTLGCLWLFHENRYATTAVILHDSTVILGKLPALERGVQFLYHFVEPSLDRGRNEEGYRRLLTYLEWYDMVSTHTFGCFGNMFYIHKDAVEPSGLLRFVRTIKTKYDFECMERISAYIAKKSGLLVGYSLCGSIFQPIANPWDHTEYATKSVDEFLADGFPFPVAKCIVGRR